MYMYMYMYNMLILRVDLCNHGNFEIWIPRFKIFPLYHLPGLDNILYTPSLTFAGEVNFSVHHKQRVRPLIPLDVGL